MFKLSQNMPGISALLMGNEAIARGAIEAGVSVCTGYPGTPSSEIIESLANVAKEAGIYVEWSVNEKVAAEVAAAASFAGLRSMVTMKNAGLNIASDFLQHHNLSGIGQNGGGMLVVVCDDPGGHSSSDEQDTRWIPRSADVPLLVPTDVQNAKDLTKWAFQISEQFKCYCVLRSYTRLSHCTGGVEMGEIAGFDKKSSYNTSQTVSIRKTAAYDTTQIITPETPFIVELHRKAHERQDKIQQVFESCSFNWYEGNENPELLIVACGSGSACAKEGIDILGLKDRVGILNITTLWPIPKKLIEKHITRSNKVLVLEETDPFLEVYVKEIVADNENPSSKIKVYGKGSGILCTMASLPQNRL